MLLFERGMQISILHRILVVNWDSKHTGFTTKEKNSFLFSWQPQNAKELMYHAGVRATHFVPWFPGVWRYVMKISIIPHLNQNMSFYRFRDTIFIESEVMRAHQPVATISRHTRSTSDGRTSKHGCCWLTLLYASSVPKIRFRNVWSQLQLSFPSVADRKSVV